MGLMEQIKAEWEKLHASNTRRQEAERMGRLAEQQYLLRRLHALSYDPRAGMDLLRSLTQHGVLCPHEVWIEESVTRPAYHIVHIDGTGKAVYMIDAFLLAEASATALEVLYRCVANWVVRIHTEAEQALLDAGAYDYYDNIEPETLI